MLVGQSVLEWSTHLGLTTRFLLLSGSCGFVNVGCCLWGDDGSVVYNCCWLSPAKSFSGSSPVGLVTIFYCLRFETSLFVASYDAHNYGGSVRLTNCSMSNTLWGGRKIIVCEKVPRLRPLVLPVRVRVKVKALEWLEAVASERGRGALISKFVFTYIILVILRRKCNFDEFKSGGLHEKHTVATWNLGTISAFAYKNV
jgi:hypothetical protein